MDPRCRVCKFLPRRIGFGRAAEKGFQQAFYPYAMILNVLCQEQYGALFVTGHSAIPRQLFWMRKAAAGGIAEASSQVTLIEKVVQQGCNYCITNSINCDGKLKCCSRCKSAWYCGKICQTNALKDGYKVDCVKYN